MAGPGRDMAIDVGDSRTIEYWDGGDPSGRAVILHPGTPETRVMGRWAHEAAVTAGVRLVAVNRPGYGGSTPSTHPSLLRTGIDTAAMAARIGLDAYAVAGVSGGGPFAVATAVADPDRVRALGIVGGIAQWRLLEDDSRDPSGSKCLDLHDAGDIAAAWECMRRDVDQAYAGVIRLDDAARADVFLARIGAGSRLSGDPAYRAIWADNMRVVVDSFDGSAYDNLAWGARWDVDPVDVVAPTRLWYGDADLQCPLAHGQWFAERIAVADLTVLPGERHLDVIDGHWPEVFAGLLGIWR